MIQRLLLNLKSAYLRTKDDESALAAVERLLLLLPDDPDEARDHGLLLYRLKQYRMALAELERYLRLRPQAPDRDVIRRRVVELQGYLSMMN
jgi:regulator of sirC expression with transglutaminase-like and TPR domain